MKMISPKDRENELTFEGFLPFPSDENLSEFGGEGSGFKGHRGRPGLVGGSSGVGTAAYNYAYASAYIDQNKRLREQSTKSNSFTRELDKQIRDNARIPDKTIYRGTSIHSVGGISAKVGDTFIDEGYGSFTENKKIANNWNTVTLVIEKENAVKMLRISDVARAPAGYGGEAEWLMPRGTTYKIIDIEPARVGHSQTYFIEVISSREKNLSSELAIENDNIDMDSLLNFVFLVHREMIENPDITEEEAEENVLEKLSYDNPSELGGPGSGFTREEGHHGRPGKVGGSQSDDDSSYEIENKPKFYTDLWFDTRATMTSDEKEAVKKYTDGYYVLINNISRGKPIGSDFTQENIESAMTYRDSLDSFVENVEAPRNMIVYRGVGLKNELAIKKLTTVGETFSDPGFLSTSLSRSVGENFMDAWSTGGTDFLLKINVDEGQKMAPIVGLAVSEMEMIFPRNTKFKVTSTNLQPKTAWMPEHWFVELEVE